MGLWWAHDGVGALLMVAASTGAPMPAVAALCSVNGVGPQTEFVLWKGGVGCSHIVRKVRHVLFFCTGAGTHYFQIASKGIQYRVKRRVIAHIRPPFTLQNIQCSIESIFAF